MRSASRRTAAVIALTSGTLAAAGCGGGGSGSNSGAHAAAVSHMVPKRILRAPKDLLSVTEPQSNGIMWALAGRKSAGLFQIDAQSGAGGSSVSVSGAARAVAESTTGIIGLALGARKSGALELLDGSTSKLIRTIPLPAPARQVTIGSDGTTFYVLNGWAKSASVTIVGVRGDIKGSVPVPADAVAAVPDIPQAQLYVLERNGVLREISISSTRVNSSFRVGKERSRSLALSPDGRTLYVLKGTSKVANIAVIHIATGSVQKVLPAPGHCREILVSANGSRLYEVTGTARYGNIQVFGV
jgi:DNA-binding beta-propeller fold protein YncE